MYLALSFCLVLELFHPALAHVEPFTYPYQRMSAQPRMSRHLRMSPRPTMSPQLRMSSAVSEVTEKLHIFQPILAKKGFLKQKNCQKSIFVSGGFKNLQESPHMFQESCVPENGECGTGRGECCDEDSECEIRWRETTTICEWDREQGRYICRDEVEEFGNCRKPFCLPEYWQRCRGDEDCCEGLTCQRHGVCMKPCVPLGEQRVGRCGEQGACCEGTVCKTIPSVGMLQVVGYECVEEVCVPAGHRCSGWWASDECCAGLQCRRNRLWQDVCTRRWWGDRSGMSGNEHAFRSMGMPNRLRQAPTSSRRMPYYF